MKSCDSLGYCSLGHHHLLQRALASGQLGPNWLLNVMSLSTSGSQEALSTLLRNVMMARSSTKSALFYLHEVLNLSPPELLGEVLLVDDHSDLEEQRPLTAWALARQELSLLPEHLERLRQDVGVDKVRLVRRESHDGIVAARNLGAKEARRELLQNIFLVWFLVFSMLFFHSFCIEIS